MDEYSRIIIEEYCMNHPKTKKRLISYERWFTCHMMLHVNQPLGN
mgnify:CR=1 FL=1